MSAILVTAEAAIFDGPFVKKNCDSFMGGLM